MKISFIFFSLVFVFGFALAQVSGDSIPDEHIFIDYEEPRPINLNEIRNLIDYPKLALDAQIEGQVVVRVLIDSAGNYVKHKVIKKVHPILSDEVELHIHKLKFTIPKDNGVGVSFWLNIPFKFKIVGKGASSITPKSNWVQKPETEILKKFDQINESLLSTLTYPTTALQDSIEGRVAIRINYGPQGYIFHRILESPNADFSKIQNEIIPYLTFPEVEKPVERVILVLNFTLSGDGKPQIDYDLE